ncbi:MAG: hypothetical protein LKJ69_12065 [Lactobacillus sp.]|jgi:hypothetical protein|nr:hypothetical protein [Lactobacillus sp.]MCI2034102.1 hypothetical protein [Lactobacillus sp.]
MSPYTYLQELATRQTTPIRVRTWENKNVIIRRNQDQQNGLVTQVWDAWLRRVLRPFGGFEPLIEIDVFGERPDIRFFAENQLADAVHFLLHVDQQLTLN